MEIYKAINIPVKCSNKDYTFLMNTRKVSAEVWNYCLELNNEYSLQKDGKWINKSQLQIETKGKFNLHAKGIQHVVHKYVFARDSALKAKQGNGDNNMYPHKQKTYFVTGWDYQSIKIDYKKGTIKLSRPKELREDGKYYPVKPIICYAKTIPQDIVQIELIWKNGLQISIKYKEEVDYLQVQSNNSASIDLGEIHSITSIDNNENAIIITGRKLRSIKQLRNKHQAKLYRRLSKCEKGSRQYWKYRKAMRNLSTKFERKINDCVHKITKHYLSYCIENDIKTVYYGDLDSATRSTKENKKGSRMTRQKLSQWNYGQIIRILETKLERYNIGMAIVKEYYTSQTCPSCKERHKPKGRNYTCKCGYKQHRDLVGAINILNDNSEHEITKYSNLKYLRIS